MDIYNHYLTDNYTPQDICVVYQTILLTIDRPPIPAISTKLRLKEFEKNRTAYVSFD